jgi:hypothetical protein
MSKVMQISVPTPKVARQQQASVGVEAPLTGLFVAGVPANTSFRTLLNYFLTFGQIDSLIPIKGKKNGCYLLKSNDLLALHAIKNFKSHCYEGRSLQISEFLTGEHLATYNQQINSRRVIVKKVLSYWTESQVEKILSEKFGSVQSIYRFKAKSQHTQSLREHRYNVQTYSVLFESSESALAAAKTHELLIGQDSLPILIERYQRKAQLRPGVSDCEEICFRDTQLNLSIQQVSDIQNVVKPRVAHLPSSGKDDAQRVTQRERLLPSWKKKQLKAQHSALDLDESKKLNSAMLANNSIRPVGDTHWRKPTSALYGRSKGSFTSADLQSNYRFNHIVPNHEVVDLPPIF